jgi:hypothetical protein
MNALPTLVPRQTTPSQPPAAGLRLAGVTGQVFWTRREPLNSVDTRLAAETLAAYGRAEELESALAQRGNSFAAMSESLLAAAPRPWPPGPTAEADAIILAYQVPDLFTYDVAGCYLTQRFAGSPVPFSVAEQGPGATFTALRIADAMCRVGELTRGALFAFDQNAAVWEAREEVQRLPDSAVLLWLGAAGPARIAELAEVQVQDADADAEGAVAALLARCPRAQVLAGQALAGRLGRLAADPRVTAAPPGHLFTSAWMSLAGRWPITAPTMVADCDHTTGRVYYCLLVPEEPG